MCRLLLIRAETPFLIQPWLSRFAEMCAASKEFQGHGWGLVWREDETWQEYKHLDPIWTADHSGFGSARWLLVHARSAFRDEGIELANNMPFHDGSHFFIFNGELRGVKVKSEGRIGAEKIFNYIRRFHKGDLAAAFRKATDLICERTEYVRAMNILMTDGERIYLTSRYSEDPDYFNLHQHQSPMGTLICSQPLGDGWAPIPNHSTLVL